MAIKRVMEVTVNPKDGSPFDLTGDDAQRALQSWDKRGQGYESGITFTNGDGNRESLDFKCICSVVAKPQTEEQAPDRPCEPVECL